MSIVDRGFAPKKDDASIFKSSFILPLNTTVELENLKVALRQERHKVRLFDDNARAQKIRVTVPIPSTVFTRFSIVLIPFVII